MTNINKISSVILLGAILMGVAFTTINIPSASASDLCGTTILVSTVLTHDQNCTDATGGITIGAAGVTLDLDGFSINCTESVAGTGYLGSCQGLGTVGVDTGGFSGVSILKGTINGFEVGVKIMGGSATVANMLITGPAAPALDGISNSRPASEGVLVSGVACIPVVDPVTGVVTLETAVNIQGSTIENHRDGVEVSSSTCVNIHQNTIRDNNSDPVACFGILGFDMDSSNIHQNLITHNGEGGVGDAGIALDGASTGNNIHQNTVMDNFGDGIKLSDAGGNSVTKNTVTGNDDAALPGFGVGGDDPFFDLIEVPGNGAADNTYKNNVFVTSSF